MNMQDLPDRRGTDSYKWDLARDGEIPLWVADMDFPVAPEITTALRERLDHPVFGYTAVPGTFREAFCAWQRERNGWEVPPEHLVVVPGVMPAISLMVEEWTQPGDGVAIFSPVYFPFFDVVQDLGRRVERIPLAVETSPTGPRHVIDTERMESVLRGCAMLLLCSPHNPGGRVWTRDELAVIADAADRHGVVVISDEIHSDLLFPGERFVPWLSVDAVGGSGRGSGGSDGPARVALLSPSKTFNIPGLPTAFAVVPREGDRRDLERLLHARKQDMSNLLAITAADAAYRHGAAWLDEIREVLYGNYRTVLEQLTREPGIAVYRMEGTFIAWIDFRRRPGWAEVAGASERFDEVARDHGVWLSRGRQFGPEGEGHMRLNFATSPGRLEEGLNRLRLALDAFDESHGTDSPGSQGFPGPQ